MKLFVMIVALILCLTFIVGCEKKEDPPVNIDCSNQMVNVKNQLGVAEEIITYNSDGYHNVDWWYWSKGIEYSFTWGKYTDGCEVSTYTFTPINLSSLSIATKATAKSSKVLVEQFFCPGTTRSSIPTQ